MDMKFIMYQNMYLINIIIYFYFKFFFFFIINNPRRNILK